MANGRPVDFSGCEVLQHVSIIDSFRQEFLEYIRTHGLTSLITRAPLTETLVERGTKPDEVRFLLQVFLLDLSVTTDLAIVDPYFLAAQKNVNYPQLIEQILEPILPGLCKLTLVTLPNKVDQTLVIDIKNLLINVAPHLTIVAKTSEAFHDRLWINPVSGKGFLTGSSLSGLGKKYALVDNLQPSDVSDILAALRDENLI